MPGFPHSRGVPRILRRGWPFQPDWHNALLSHLPAFAQLAAIMPVNFREFTAFYQVAWLLDVKKKKEKSQPSRCVPPLSSIARLAHCLIALPPAESVDKLLSYPGRRSPYTHSYLVRRCNHRPPSFPLGQCKLSPVNLSEKWLPPGILFTIPYLFPGC